MAFINAAATAKEFPRGKFAGSKEFLLRQVVVVITVLLLPQIQPFRPSSPLL